MSYVPSDDDSAPMNSAAAERDGQSDHSKYPHLKQHTPDKQKEYWSNFCLRDNAGAYSEREREMYKEIGSEEIPIQNLENRAVKKSPDCGTRGR